ncbi:uncharacterized protein STEHIDRAFT_160584 [Stereum hirsutum FP-91666 SS1]|uniref:uncharacterized protein n=1 Tax=Stereum hirsutum (strain FP-91666) TaxID=721885 RepID=UPI0004449E09|nr:uncharacterized protein STEHIDRAFT_160584 [Stereum hirsutum FP-91666 SS1]EIM82972.1 hypothetical protein STEHIDRAFT_160584 [Stereum hirsutum FP-91666 SS1]
MSSEQHNNHVAGGYKATLHNPNTSTEAKHNASQKLEELGQTGGSTARNHTSHTGGLPDQSQHDHRVLGGYKATLNRPGVSEEAKRHAREVLEASGYSVEMPEGSTEDEHDTRVLAGYRAALNNDRVSPEAKKHAREFLGEHNAL